MTPSHTPKTHILIQGAKLHNLKNITLAIPKNKLVVITGLSGSGKSTLAFDTLYAEGQRRYVESLSSYARQFLGKLEKPQVDSIKGIAPAIAIEQKVNSTNPRSTVGTTTEIYDYLKLLYARIGETFSPISGNKVNKDSVTDVLDFIQKQPEGTGFLLLAPFKIKHNRTFQEELNILQQQGFARLSVEGRVQKIQDLIDFNFEPTENQELFLVIDRSVVIQEESYFHRLADAVQTAFYEGEGRLLIRFVEQGNNQAEFSNAFELDGIQFTEPNLHFFSFNNPYGACPTCEGYGQVIGIDEKLVIPNTSLSIYEGAVVAWNGEKMSEWQDRLIQLSDRIDFPIHRSYYELTQEEKDILWRGKGSWKGINGFFKMVEENTYKIQYRVMLSRYRGKTICPDCQGKRLRKETHYVQINGKPIQELIDLPLNELKEFFNNLKLSDFQKKIAKRILHEINSRIGFLLDVGLSYLTLNRNSNSLSGGESQRINLATSLGSSLVGSLYILDEPSIGLHSRDTDRLIQVLKKLRDLGNTVIVVEHDEEIMQAADHIIDIGPEAGTNGGQVVFEGSYKELLKAETLTAKYLNGKMEIALPDYRLKGKRQIKIKGARQNNLKNIDVQIPLNCLTVVSGVSGSGKSTLIGDILAPAIQRKLDIYKTTLGEFDGLESNIMTIRQIEMVDQNPIGKSSRSNPATYVKVFDEIRNLFAKQKLSKVHDYKPKHFSFNVEGGRCETCQGEGTITVGMQFMADIEMECEECKGQRFKQEILEVKFMGASITDVLEMTVDDAIQFFKEHREDKIIAKLKPLQDVGLGYVKLGQSSKTLSGGEAQRIKLAYFLSKGDNAKHTLFIFDEPSTGLHFHDIHKLLKSFRELIAKGHSILVIEHHLDIIKSADYLIDLGPEAGKNGGQLVAAGTPEEVAKNPASITGTYLKPKLKPVRN